MKTKRTYKEISRIVATTIHEIRKGMVGMQDEKKNDFIKDVCEKNEIGEKHIRLVAGW